MLGCILLTMHAVGRSALIGRLLYGKAKEGVGGQMELVGASGNILGFRLAEVASQGMGQ